MILTLTIHGFVEKDFYSYCNLQVLNVCIVSYSDIYFLANMFSSLLATAVDALFSIILINKDRKEISFDISPEKKKKKVTLPPEEYVFKKGKILGIEAYDKETIVFGNQTVSRIPAATENLNLVFLYKTMYWKSQCLSLFLLNFWNPPPLFKLKKQKQNKLLLCIWKCILVCVCISVCNGPTGGVHLFSSIYIVQRLVCYETI